MNALAENAGWFVAKALAVVVMIPVAFITGIQHLHAGVRPAVSKAYKAYIDAIVS